MALLKSAKFNIPDIFKDIKSKSKISLLHYHQAKYSVTVIIHQINLI